MHLTTHGNGVTVPNFPAIVIRHGLFGFFPAVHHERSDLHDRLVDGRATNRDKSYRAG
jgi:hypothetical protein